MSPEAIGVIAVAYALVAILTAPSARRLFADSPTRVLAYGCVLWPLFWLAHGFFTVAAFIEAWDDR